MWGPAERLLKTRFKHKTWRDGVGKSLGTFHVGSGKGKPDVIAISKDLRVHFVEGKLLSPARHMFHQTMSQLRDWTAHADSLWAAFSVTEWRATQAKQRQAWEASLREQGFGLILVEENRAEIEIEANPNSRVNGKKRDEVLKRFGESRSADEVKVPAFLIGRDDSLQAARAAAWCYDLFDVEAREVARVSKRKPVPAPTTSDNRVFAWDGWFDKKEKRSITADPFGSYIGDGRPVLLVWLHIGSWDRLPSRPIPPGAFLFAQTKDEQEFRTVPFTEATDERGHLEDEGLTDVWLAWQVPIEDRRRKGIKASLEEIWNQLSVLTR